MSDSWKHLDWAYVCDQAPAIQAAWDRDNDRTEYGVNFFEFIHTAEGLESKAQRWWDSLTPARRHNLLRARIEALETQLALAQLAERKEQECATI